MRANSDRMILTLAEEVRANLDRQAQWTNREELLATVADRLGVLAAGHQYTEPPDRIRRPHEPDPSAPVSPAAFARMLIAR